MTASPRRAVVGMAAALLVILSISPAAGGLEPPSESPAAEAATEDRAPLVEMEEIGSSSVQPLATPNRIINGDGGTSGKCLEIAGGGPTSELVQMAPCRSYAHQGWRLRQWLVSIPYRDGFIDIIAFTVESHDPDAAGRCLTYMGQATQARMRPCGRVDNLWFRNQAPNGWFQLESVWAWSISQDRPENYKCLDVHVDRSRTTNVVHSWTCGPLNKGNQLFRVQAA